MQYANSLHQKIGRDIFTLLIARRKRGCKAGIHKQSPMDQCERIEKLVALDLGHLRKPWKCIQCCCVHGEWFKLKEEKAVEIVKVWVKWSNEQGPYNHDKTLEPIWTYLIKKARLPTRVFEDLDHTARWDHWSWVLSQPTDNDTGRFHDNKAVFPYQSHERHRDPVATTPYLMDLPPGFRVTAVERACLESTVDLSWEKDPLDIAEECGWQTGETEKFLLDVPPRIKLTQMDRLGQGAVGIVWEVRSGATAQTMALKSIQIPR